MTSNFRPLILPIAVLTVLTVVAVGAVKVQSAMQQASAAATAQSQQLTRDLQQVRRDAAAVMAQLDRQLATVNVQYHPGVAGRPGYYSKLDPAMPVSPAWDRVIVRSRVMAGKVGVE